MDIGEIAKQYGWVAAVAIVFVYQYIINSGQAQRTISIERKAVAKAQADFSTAFTTADEERRSLQSQINAMSLKFDKQDKLNSHLEEDNRRLMAKDLSQQTLINDQTTKISGLVSQGEKSIGRIEELEKDLNTERGVTKKLRTDIQKNNDLAAARIAQMQKDYARVQLERDEARQQRDGQVLTHKSEVSQLNEEIGKLRLEVAELTRKVNGTASETEAIRSPPSV